MSFTVEVKPPAIWDTFTYYTSGDLLNAGIDDSFAPSKRFKLGEIRLHLSTAAGSVVDLYVWLSSILNSNASEYNITLLSQAMNGLHTVQFQADPATPFLSGDQINISCELSAANIFALEISGWSIQAVGT